MKHGETFELICDTDYTGDDPNDVYWYVIGRDGVDRRIYTYRASGSHSVGTDTDQLYGREVEIWRDADQDATYIIKFTANRTLDEQTYKCCAEFKVTESNRLPVTVYCE